MKDDYDYHPDEHPIREFLCMAISPIGWVIFVFLLLLICGIKNDRRNKPRRSTSDTPSVSLW